jgi:hypothetical protein
MILTKLGTVSTAHAVTAGSVKSEEVLNLGALGVNGFGPGGNRIFIDLETVVAAGGGTTSTYQFQLVVSDTADLSANRKEILSVTITGAADVRIAAAGRKILTMELPDQVWRVMKANAGYVYCGWWVTLANGNGVATLTYNGAFSPSRPRTDDNMQVTASPVNLPA